MKALQLLFRLARIEPTFMQTSVELELELVGNPMRESGVAIRVGHSRVEVLAGFDVGTLRSVLSIVGELG